MGTFRRCCVRRFRWRREDAAEARRASSPSVWPTSVRENLRTTREPPAAPLWLPCFLLDADEALENPVATLSWDAKVA